MKNVKKICLLSLICVQASYLVSINTISTTYVSSYNNGSQEKNDNPLVEAIQSKEIKRVASLIKTHNVNESDKYGKTPLMAAVSTGDVAIIKLLIDAGADIEKCDNNGNTPLMYALFDSISKEAVVALLLALKVKTRIMNNQEQTPLILATLNNHCESIKLLLKNKVNIEERGARGLTSLGHAVDNGCIMAAELLISNGANLEARDSMGWTPLMLATFRNNVAMIKALITAGANINSKSTKASYVEIKKSWHDFWGEKISVSSGITALDIAKQFELIGAQHILTEYIK